MNQPTVRQTDVQNLMLRDEIARAVRWGVKSVGGLMANLALLTVWVDLVGFAAWWAVGINWLLISIGGYLLTDQWVFPEGDTSGIRGHARQYVGMQGVMTGGKIANWLCYVALLPYTDYRVAWSIGAVLTFGFTFLGNRWLFIDSQAQ